MSKRKVFIVPTDKINDYIDPIWELKKPFYTEYPYLHQPDSYSQSREVVEKYLTLPRTILIVAEEDDEVVAAIVGAPLTEVFTESDLIPYRKFFYKTKTKAEDFTYSIWTLTKPSSRGTGLNNEMGNLMEEEVKKRGFKGRIIINVVRPVGDPRAPEGYRPSGPFFVKKRGYVPINIPMLSSYWTDIGDETPTEKLFEHFVRWV